MYSNELVVKILNYIDDNLYKRITMDEISSIFYFNKDYLMRIFKKELDITIMDYINKRRIYNSLELLKNTDVFILNETEAEFVTKVCPDTEENRIKCMNILKDYGISTVVLTLGAEGSVYTEGSCIKYQKAYKAEVVDTTAAGDTFIGAFCMKMKEGIETAVKYATAASSITVSRKGASESIPTGAEVDELTRNIK